jgi:hypothetical protein
MGKCCANFCKSFIVFVNFVIGLLGLTITGLSIYLIVEYYKYDQYQGESYWIVWAPFITGVLISLLALVGCCITIAENKCFLGIYGFLQLVFGIVIVVSGAGLLVWTYSLENVSQVPTNQVSSASGNSDINEFVSDFTYGMLTACCSVTIPQEQCSSSSGNPCFYNQQNFESGTSIDSSICQEFVFDQVGFTCSSNPIIDPVEAESDLKSLQADLGAYSKSYFEVTGIIFIICGGALFVCMIGSFYLCCCKGKSGNSNKAPQTTTGGAAAGTGGPSTGYAVNMA